MKPILTLSHAAKALATVDYYNWHRGHYPRSGSLTLYQDDLENDRRTVTVFDFSPHGITRTRKHLSGYDAGKNMWTRHPQGEERHDLLNRGGEKKLREAVAIHAVEETGFPNPETFTRYKVDAKREARGRLARHEKAVMGY